MIESILVNKKVLVAEDNAINQMVVKHALLKLGASADITGDGAEAIEKFKTDRYDLILMDVQMPLMDGYEATGYIRNRLGSNVPIIAMTAFALKGEDEKCYEAGMNGYVAKPFTIESLSETIKKVISIPGKMSNNPFIVANKEVAVDMSMLYDISGNDEAYIQMMIRTFLENMPATLEKIEQGLHEDNWEGVYKAAHYAKSSLSVIKILEMSEPMLKIEQNAKNRVNLEEIDCLFDKAKEKFRAAEQLLTEKFGEPVH